LGWQIKIIQFLFAYFYQIKESKQGNRMKKNLYGILVLWAIVLIIVVVVFKPLLVNPNSFLFSKSGEALKSYYNFSYQLKYSSGEISKGTNFPYGENIQMDNSHPFHLWFFHFINKIVPVSKHGVALLNLSMLLSLFLALPFIFLLLRRYKMPVWYSVIVSLIILFLSTQLACFKGHLELAYLFFIPMWWYFLLKFRDGKTTWLWGSLVVNSAILAGFISQWHLVIYFLFLVGILFADIWINRKKIGNQLVPGINLFLMAVVPVIVVRGALLFNDPFINRPENLFGFFDNNANIFSIFLPFDSLIPLISKYGYTLLNIKPEGHANIGFLPIIVAIVLGSLILYRFYTRKNIAQLFPINEFNPFLLSATLLLLFSMNFPFNCGLGFLLKLFPVLKLFIAPGRIAWAFFYVFTIYAAIIFFNYLEKLKSEGHKKRHIWILTIMLVFWGYDAVANTLSNFNKIVNNNDRLESNGADFMKRFDKMGKNPASFQAVLSLPFSNSASDKMEFKRGYDALGEAMKLSYHSGLPIIESLSPRQSIGQSLSAIQLLSDSCIRKTRFNDMNDKPILLLTMNGSLSENEKWMKLQADSLWGDPWLTLSKISPSTIKNSYQNWLSWAETKKSTLTGTEILKADTTLNKLYYLNFDNNNSENAFTGNGTFFKKKGKIELFNEDFPAKGMTGDYELSFWLFFDKRTNEMPKAILNEIDRYNFPINPIKLNTSEVYNICHNWVRINQEVSLKPDMKYQLVIEGNYITIDNLLLKPVKSNVYMKFSPDKEMMNNFLMEK
jgi:hypothetical protein